MGTRVREGEVSWKEEGEGLEQRKRMRRLGLCRDAVRHSVRGSMNKKTRKRMVGFDKNCIL